MEQLQPIFRCVLKYNHSNLGILIEFYENLANKYYDNTYREYLKFKISINNIKLVINYSEKDLKNLK